MTRRAIIRSGAAATRAALMDGEAVLRFWFGPARGDAPATGATGSIVKGRIRTVNRSLSAAFVDVGFERDGFLPFDGAAPIEGESGWFAVRRPAIAEKGAVLAPVAPPTDQESTDRAGKRPDPALEALSVFGSVENVVVNDAQSALLFRAAGVEADIDEQAWKRADLDAALAGALSREAPLAGGGRLIFDECEAMTVVDVDSGAAAGEARGRLNDRINHVAAGRLFGELARRRIGGRIVVDFPPPSDAKARADLIEALKRAAKGVFQARFGALRADGLFDLTAPRRERSLLEEASERAPADMRGGRRFTRDWAAKAAIAAFEDRLAARPAARLGLLLGGDLYDYVCTENAPWLARLEARFGARFSVMRLGTEDRVHDVVE